MQLKLIKCDDNFIVNSVCSTSVIRRIFVLKRGAFFLQKSVLVIQERTRKCLYSIELALILQRAKPSCISGFNHLLNFKHVLVKLAIKSSNLSICLSALLDQSQNTQHLPGLIDQSIIFC